MIFFVMEYDGCVKSFAKRGSRVALQIFLFATFLSFFGAPALEKYNRKDVMVVNTVKNTNGIPIPAITVDVLDDMYDSCLYENESLINSCIDKSAKNWTQIINAIMLGMKRRKVVNLTEEIIQEEFTHVWSGRSATLDLPFRIGPIDIEDQLFILLDPKIKHYEIFIHDPQFFVHNLNPTLEPVLYVAARSSSFYYPLELTEMKEIDNPSDPCNSNVDYSFRKCVQQSVTSQVSQKLFLRSYL